MADSSARQIARFSFRKIGSDRIHKIRPRPDPWARPIRVSNGLKKRNQNRNLKREGNWSFGCRSTPLPDRFTPTIDEVLQLPSPTVIACRPPCVASLVSFSPSSPPPLSLAPPPPSFCQFVFPLSPSSSPVAPPSPSHSPIQLLSLCLCLLVSLPPSLFLSSRSPSLSISLSLSLFFPFFPSINLSHSLPLPHYQSLLLSQTGSKVWIFISKSFLARHLLQRVWEESNSSQYKLVASFTYFWGQLWFSYAAHFSNKNSYFYLCYTNWFVICIFSMFKFYDICINYGFKIL